MFFWGGFLAVFQNNKERKDRVVPLSVPGESVPTVPVSGSGSDPEPPRRKDGLRAQSPSRP